MSGSRQPAEQLIYQCPECGNKFPVWKTMNSRNRERSKEGHIKDLYCYRCEKVTKHEQLSNYIPMFKEVNMKLNLVQRNGAWYADSREVAEATDKRHDHLIRDIEGYIQIMTETPNLGNGVTVQVSDFFAESHYLSGTPTRPYKNFLITRRGCDMVANKMTGEKGVLFTAAYVTKFEEMEKALQPVPKSPAELIAAGYKAALDLIEEMKPKAQKFDQLIDSTNVQAMEAAAKVLNIGRNTLFKLLRIHKVFTERNLPGQTFIDRGYFVVKEYPMTINGDQKMYAQSFVTARGINYLHEFLDKHRHDLD